MGGYLFLIVPTMFGARTIFSLFRLCIHERDGSMLHSCVGDGQRLVNGARVAANSRIHSFKIMSFLILLSIIGKLLLNNDINPDNLIFNQKFIPMKSVFVQT